MRILKWILVLGVIGSVGVFAWRFAQGNAAPVDVDLVWHQYTGVALWRVAVAALALGALLVAFVAGVLGARGWLVKRRYRKAIKQLESEVHQLRSLPLSQDAEPIAGGGDPAIARGRG